jgi:hypothetical protein
MAEVIDFQLKRGDILRRKAEKCAARSSDHTARSEWLKRNGAPLVDQVRASLDASKAINECRQIEQTLARIEDGVPGGLQF